ncbi:HotDog domain-containing protein [Rhypophila decipiens]|uniref:HotDog domain-containing protein n=1 Tax=Rhypophila decipiens TaxID=261697 RepID=A0AAN6XYL4_9PEZI|nr:HotDog domain-containing protein [Rhypophila decipiens]
MPPRLSLPAARCRILTTPRTPRTLRTTSARSLSAPTASAASVANSPISSRVRRGVSLGLRALLFASVGFIMATAPAYQSATAIVSPPSDADTLSMFSPADDDALAKEEFIDSHPLTKSLRENPDFIEARPHMKIPPSWRKHNLTGGTLIGPGKVAVPPFSWTEKNGKEFVQISHVGTDLCGHMGIIHGGFLATILDEGLGRCCFPVLPFNIGMTAKLEINYKAPAMADQYLVMRARTVKVEGRKAWVEGHIETLPTKEGEEPTILATGSALYVSPKQAATMAKIYPVT